MASFSKIMIEFGVRDKTQAGLRSARKEVEATAKAVKGLSTAMKGASVVGGVMGRGISAGFSIFKNSIGGMIMLGSDLSETLSKNAKVFGDNAKSIESWAKDAARNMGMSKTEAIAAAGTLGNLFKGVGVSAEKLPEFSKNIVQAAADLGSFNNADPAEVLDALQSGLVGNAEPLRKYGILLSESAVQAKGMEMGLADANGELSEGAKVQARYALIMEQMGDAAGDYVDTQDGLANGLRTLSALWKEAQTWMGGKIAPTLAKLVNWVNTLVTSFKELTLSGMEPWAAAMKLAREQLEKLLGKGNAQRVINVINAIGDGFAWLRAHVDDVERGFRKVLSTVMPLFNFLADNLDTVIPALKGAVIGLGALAVAMGVAAAAAFILNISLSPLTLAILAVIAIGALLGIAWSKNWGGIREKTAAAIDYLVPKIQSIWESLQPVIKGIKLFGSYLKAVITGDVQPAGAALAIFPKWLRPVIFLFGRLAKTLRILKAGFDKGGLLGALKVIPTQLRALGRALAGIADSLGLHNLADAIRQTFADIGKLFSQVVSLVDNIVHGRWSKALGDMRKIAISIVWLMIDRLRLAAALIVDVFILIPWKKVGLFIIRALWKGIVWVWDNELLPFIQKIPGWLSDAMKAGYNLLYQAGNYLIAGLSSGVAFAWDWMISWVKQIPGWIVDQFNSAYNSFYNVGSYLIGAVASGIGAGWTWLMDWLTTAYNDLPWWMRAVIEHGASITADVVGSVTGGGDGVGASAMGGASVPAAAMSGGGSAGGGDTFHITVVESQSAEATARELMLQVARRKDRET